MQTKDVDNDFVFVLKKSDSSNSQYYVKNCVMDMLIEVTQESSEAKRFNNDLDAIHFCLKYRFLLKGMFDVLQLNKYGYI